MDFKREELARPQRPLLQTKLFMPRSRTDLVARPRLLDKLNTAVSSNGILYPKLTLVTAPAGYGKSTLTTQWVSQLPHSCAWLSLDSTDNDEARFLAYFFAAIGTIHSAVGESALARLTTTYLYNEAEAILTAFLNDLAASEETAVIVLDDYHLITADAVHQIVTFILQHAPPQLHLVITSRNHPPLPIALLRAQNALNWVNQHDLRFTHEEAAYFLRQTMNLEITLAQIEALDSQVEGWVTGLQLIGLALKDAVALPEATSGNQRYLVDYLADQVLNKQPEPIQEFLLKTAVLNRFCAPLCDALLARTEQSNSARAILRQIETANLFLIPLDVERNWYRYHHLFSDFLNGRLNNRQPAAEIARLHHCAARWYHQNGDSLIAVEHALAAGEYQLAADIISSVGREVLMFGEGITLREWMSQLPDDIQHADPKLVLFHIWALIRTGDMTQAMQLLDAISDRLDTPLLWGEWSALRARLAVMTGDTDINIRFSNKALLKLPPDQHMLRSEVAINLGFSHLQLADIAAAREAFAEAAQQTAHDPGLWAVMFATFYWGNTYERELQLQAALNVYKRGLAKAEAQASDSSAVGFMHVGLGQLYYEWNLLAEAETHLHRAVQCAERSGDHKMTIYSLEGLAQLYNTLGDWEQAKAILTKLETEMGSDGPSTRRAILALQAGDLKTVQQWQKKLDISLGDAPEKVRSLPLAYLTLVRLHLAQQMFDHIIPILQTVTEFAQERNNKRFLVSVLLLHAVALGKQGELSTAVPIFHRALSLAEQGGLKRTILNLQEPTLIRLLHLSANNGVTARYAQKLLGYISPDSGNEAETAVSPLSRRELELLHFLAQGLTNRQIANQMTVSLNTVKAHTRRLYAKLDVHNRTEAVTRARECQII